MFFHVTVKWLDGEDFTYLSTRPPTVKDGEINILHFKGHERHMLHVPLTSVRAWSWVLR